MRLRKIRLAGFKSFVDPTTVSFPGDLIGVVGPNGCGKSNIIDAVRWVMGEISAKHLRGDSMADVVFNGSNARKPLGQASVELVFDNSEGRLGGRYASYAEIAVKRQVTRDGQSAYFLNGTRCRRRDITDLFLGTGLGARSYAILEQGIISRLIEARPDELREFIEEAAGISRYKERRRETENRIRHTQENLDRLNDIRDELDKRLTHLKRQATMAARYRTLKAEERKLQAELLGLRWRGLDAEANRQAQLVAAQENALEAVVAAQRELETRLLREREEQATRNERYNAAYMQVQDAAASIARAEAAIQQQEGHRQQLRDGMAREQTALERAREHATSEMQRQGALGAELAALEPALADVQARAGAARENFRRCEEAMHDWQARFEDLSQRVAHPAQAAEAERARIRHGEEQLVQLDQRARKLAAERAALDAEDLAAGLALLETQVEEDDAAQCAAEDALDARQAHIRETRERMAESSAELDHERSRLQERRGRLASLQALQQAALGKREGGVVEWLHARGGDTLPRLAERLQVEPGWERALEQVLDFHLEAVCVDGLDGFAAQLHTLVDGSLGFYEESDRVPEPEGAVGPRLASMVRAPAGIRPLLAGIHAVPDLATALSMRSGLQPGESAITPEGEWVGPNWLHVSRSDVDHAGVLAREQEIRSLCAESETLAQTIAEGEHELAQTRERLRDEEDEHSEARRRFVEGQRVLAQRKAELARRQTRYAQARQRTEAIEAEHGDIAAQARERQQTVSDARQRLQALTDDMQRLGREREQWAARRQEYREQLDEARDVWQALRDEAYELGLKAQSARTQLAALDEARARNDEQVVSLDTRCRELNEELTASEHPLQLARENLDQQLAARRRLEQTLVSARESVDAGESELRHLEQRRHEVEQAVEQERAALERLRVGSQETVVRRTTVEEQLALTGQPLPALLEGLPEEGDAADWERRLEEIGRSIGRLGAINLAAIEEFEQQSERKGYLDKQHADLDEALATLQSAIHKIDRETRARFKETYEKVNAGLGAMFPKLFGGGAAYLEMTGDDLLSTGIALMARPPGKRNSTIHLLSGGEKALTALALVFSIFELNPAPFCLLDEVDAPLDDANVVRFSELVREMSERLQIIVVTHNKTTMEIAQQLIGVTMQEPGVSRLVAVDVDEAVEMVAL